MHGSDSGLNQLCPRGMASHLANSSAF